MSAIGGIIHQNPCGVNAALLAAMSRSLFLRGRDGRFAYLGGGVGIFHNRSQAEAPLADAQPLIFEQPNGICSVVVDGWFDSADDAAKHLLLSYQQRGAACAEDLRGSFAAAICDEARAEVLLLRDRQGSRPLYYIAEQDRLLFASEIKALIRALDTPLSVDLNLLRAHILAPCGSYAGESLYRSVCALPPAHAALYSRLGLSLFPLEDADEHEPSEDPIGLPAPFVCPDKESLRRILTEVLFAFDYPQFDHLMPAFLKTLASATATPATRQIAIEDATLWSNIPYSRERADRLGRGFGVHAVSVPPKDWSLSPKALRRFAELLGELLDEQDPTRIRYLFGSDFRKQLESEKNLGKRIRMLGMLYQSLFWEEHYPIRWI